MAVRKKISPEDIVRQPQRCAELLEIYVVRCSAMWVTQDLFDLTFPKTVTKRQFTNCF